MKQPLHKIYKRNRKSSKSSENDIKIEEHPSFHDLADRIIEEKDNEISRLLDDNKNLRQSLQSRSQVNHNDNYSSALHKLDATIVLVASATGSWIFHFILARQQAQREEELARSQRHSLALQGSENEYGY
ncbi:hypothetical protein RIF29_16444 [Crotalaria pallida]|uniref:Uncharacterized protein n=1 Tax=Crotalaria pallida TaxID=3830 RepID=A0AAN9FHB3_CROPI